MAGFVDCTKYNKEQQEQDTRIENLEKRETVHDETLKGGGIDKESPLGLKKSDEKDNAIKTDEKGVYVKDLEPQVEKLEEALKNKYDRLGNDLEARIRELNGRLNALKDIEVALAAAKAEGNYNKIKELEARLQAAKEAQQTGDKGLAEAIEALRKQGLTDEQIRKIIDDAVAKAGGTGRYITRIETNQNDGTVTYYYSDGTSATGKLANFGGVVADQRSIVGNGNDQALTVQLSKLGGNQLKKLDDGLYFGYQARPEDANLYVSSVSGNDANTGTRDKPLRTVHAALNRIAEVGLNGGYNIFLKCGEDHEFPHTRVWLPQALTTILFSWYGDAKYPDERTVFNEGIIYNPMYAPDLNRPRLYYTDYNDANLGIVYSGINTNGTLKVAHHGIDVSYERYRAGGVVGAGFYHEELSFEGCIVRLPKVEVPLGSASIVRLRSNKLMNLTDNVHNFLISDLTPSVWVFDMITEQGQSNKYPSYAHVSGNEKQVLKPTNICGLSEVNIQTRTSFGFSTNWDIFNNA